MALKLYETLFGLVEDGYMDVLVTKAREFNSLLNKASLTFAKSDVSIDLVRNFLSSIYKSFSHFYLFFQYLYQGTQ